MAFYAQLRNGGTLELGSVRLVGDVSMQVSADLVDYLRSMPSVHVYEVSDPAPEAPAETEETPTEKSGKK